MRDATAEIAALAKEGIHLDKATETAFREAVAEQDAQALTAEAVVAKVAAPKPPPKPAPKPAAKPAPKKKARKRS